MELHKKVQRVIRIATVGNICTDSRVDIRHFAGVETITEQDIQEARIFEDWVVTKAHFNFDAHNMTGNGLDAIGSQETFKQVKG